MADGARITLHRAVRNEVAARPGAGARGYCGWYMNPAWGGVADETAAGWSVPSKSMSSAAGGTAHGVKAATRPAAWVKAAAAMEAARSPHASWMEAACTSVKASSSMEAATRMEAAATRMKTSTAGMEAAASAAVEAATAAAMETAATTAMRSASTAAVAWGSVREVYQCEARDGASEDCGDHR